MQRKQNVVSPSMTVTFYGGTGSVTGANFLLTCTQEDGTSLNILIDCGLMQGTQIAEAFNADQFPYDPKDIDMLFVTHAHMDHIGRIPKLIKAGFAGRILSTSPTKDMAAVLFDDEFSIMEHDMKRSGVEPLYSRDDIARALSVWETLPYHTIFSIGTLSVYLRDSGHILGSAMVEIRHKGEAILFTGDLGNSPSLLLPDTEEFSDATAIVMESVYGDRNHEPKEERRKKLIEIMKDTIDRKRVLIIPAFSIERTQMILYEMNEIFGAGIVPKIPVFLDSPLAIKITKIYERYPQYLNTTVQNSIAHGDDVFKFPNLTSTPFSWEYEKIESTHNPKIIIAGSGMSSGGRIVHHERDHIGDEHATILLVGYQALGTLGRQMEDGAAIITMYGTPISVKARIEKIAGYSSHKDSDHLVDFVEQATQAGTLKKVFVVMGEPKASLFLVQRLRNELGVDAEYPHYGETVEF